MKKLDPARELSRLVKRFRGHNLKGGLNCFLFDMTAAERRGWLRIHFLPQEAFFALHYMQNVNSIPPSFTLFIKSKRHGDPPAVGHRRILRLLLPSIPHR
mmetsp:Transcript_32739/g.70717  ORF Transcript_32739/g.70717 Transcript_32739/m.70717 type:complete len:100 (-) Transcript_32739:87-386(-)